MPGNGNSQLNYQQRKQLQKENVLKRQASNEQYKLNKNPGSNQASASQYGKEYQLSSNNRGNSLDDNKVGPHKAAMTNNYMAGHNSRPVSSNVQPNIMMQNQNAHGAALHGAKYQHTSQQQFR